MSGNDPISTKPYLVRAIYEWCTDNGYTPYVAVSVSDQTRVPRAHVRNGEIVLNVSSLATDQLSMANDFIRFQARFSGRVHEIMVPIENVVAIYAKETGNGMAFEVSKPLAEAEPHLQAVEELSDNSEPSSSGPDGPTRPPAGG
ncbi:MAG: ClpXP protease specificity-enhancing factor, partial [Burkholderiaceae bacterium]